MRDFFDISSSRDWIYAAARDDPGAAAYARDLFATSEPFLDDDRPEAAANDFHPVWWEMYLAAALLKLGVPLTPRERKRHRRGGPDLQVDPTPIWVEAIAVSRGSGADAVPEIDFSLATQTMFVPDERLLLRISHAIETKCKKYLAYRKTGHVKEGEPFVVAVNGGFIPNARFDTEVPRIARVVFGIGELTVHVDRETLQVVREDFPPMLSVKKVNQEDVPLAFFARPEYAFLSAVIWGGRDPFNTPDVLGRDLTLVHNPKATAPLPRGWIREGSEYWVDNGQLQKRVWWREIVAAGATD